MAFRAHVLFLFINLFVESKLRFFFLFFASSVRGEARKKFSPPNQEENFQFLLFSRSFRSLAFESFPAVDRSRVRFVRSAMNIDFNGDHFCTVLCANDIRIDTNTTKPHNSIISRLLYFLPCHFFSLEICMSDST
jgi:hypothetical protein